MWSKKEINTVVKDFLEGRMSLSEQKKFINRIRSLKDDTEQSDIYENIYNQISTLSNKEQKRLFELLKDANAQKKTGLTKRIALLLPYAAIFIAVIGVVFLLNNFFVKQSETPLTYHNETPLLKILKDGSEVYLDSGSTLEVMEYNKHARVVSLQGKARFSVKPDDAAFFVKTKEGLYTKVLGTKFSVSAYKNDFEVAVEKGRVWVGDEGIPIGVLSKGDTITVKNGVVKRSPLFEENQLTFNNIPLHEVLNTLQEKFDTPINLGNSVEKNIRTNAQFPDDLTLIEIVDVLCEIHGYKRTITEDEINIIAN